jgi:glycosyltransferase involved in cell wall biosynthesis
MKYFLAKKSVLLHLIMLRLGTDHFLSTKEPPSSKAPRISHDKSDKKKRILIVGMSESSHLHSWLEGIADSGIAADVWLFPSDFPVRKYRNSKIDVKEFPYFFLGKLTNLTFRFLDILTSGLWRSYFLHCEIQRIKPTHLHFHETQHGAYLYNPIAKHPKNKFDGNLILSTWGSDLIVYGKVKSHSMKVEQTLSWVDLLTSEREEDLEIAMINGFQGKFLAPIYISVGNKKQDIAFELTSKRNLILIKGYQDNHGRALNALKSIEILSSQMDLSKFKIKVFSASESVRLQVELLSNGIDIEVLPRLSKVELMSYFEKARVYLGLAISDGLSTSMVEAMSYGAFPIQSQNSSAPEFLTNGVTGGVVDPWNLQEVASLLKTALTNDKLVDQAAISNREIVNYKYSWEIGVSKLAEVYE